MDRKAREEAVAFRLNAQNGIFPAQGWPELDDNTPLHESPEGIKLYDRYRAEYYGYMSIAVISAVESVVDKAPQRGEFGLARYNGKPVESIKTFHDLYQTVLMSLLKSADDSYFNNPNPPEALSQLQELMNRLSYLVEGAYADPKSAIGDGINTAASGMVLLLESMSKYLKRQYPKLGPQERFAIINNSGRNFVSLALQNLYGLHAITYSNDVSALINEFELQDDQIVLTTGSFEELGVLPYFAEKVGVNDGIDTSDAKVKDISFPYSHIGCPITLKPKTIIDLWRVGAHAANRAELL